MKQGASDRASEGAGERPDGADSQHLLFMTGVLTVTRVTERPAGAGEIQILLDRDREVS